MEDRTLNIWQYFRSIAISKSIVAILFVFRPGRDADKATLDSCTGWVKHMGRFRESRTYEFTLDGQLSKGDVEVTLLDAKKEPLMKLNQQSPVGKIDLDAKNRYFYIGNLRVLLVSVSCVGKRSNFPFIGQLSTMDDCLLSHFAG